ncbi:MAG: VWA domain-containing protein [Rhizobiales bacterium]|nr:VWA domain-containing protein [Hyphomicrobiales bacterium]
MKHQFETLRRKMRAFASAQRGNVAITFALAMIPVIGAVGAAVDYSRANSTRTALQAAVDSTALMLSKDAASLTSAQLNPTATAYFNAIFTRPEAKEAKVTPSYSKDDGSQVTVNGTATVPTQFVGLMGFSTIAIGANSTVRWGNSRLRVALALDVTGSMASAGKMNALKTAAKNFLTQLKGAASVNGDVYVSIIPFSKDVNADPVNFNATWVRWDLWDEVNGDCSKDTKKKEYGSKTACAKVNGTWTPDNHNTWNGCITDRDQDYDTKNTAPNTGISGTLFPAEQYSSCPVPVMGLSYDWTALNSKIDSLQPTGNTNQAIGLQWAYQSLTSAPFIIPALDPKYKYSQVIILMSDGRNTQDRWYNSAPQIDARQKITCDNVKSAGITMYTIQVNTGGDPKSTLLEQCASGPDKYFLLTSASQIVKTFESIGTALSQLRIAK